tara:strand:- start:1333 stop:1845 length:513 start_codon:yes stop_codon:yes gene_type:complete
MANKGLANLSASILPDEVKSRLNGQLSTLTDSNNIWIYKNTIVGITSKDIFDSSSAIGNKDTYFGNEHREIASGDKIWWVAIKHSGTSDGSMKTSQHVMVSHTGATPAFNGTGATSGILIGPGEMVVLKLSGVTVADLHALSVNGPGGKPTSTGLEGVYINVAAIVENIA